MSQKKRQRQPFSAKPVPGSGSLTARSTGELTTRKLKRRSLLLSLGIIGFALALSFAPLPGTTHQIIVLSGTELEEPLRALQPRFQEQYPDIQLELRFQGSQDIVNQYLDDDHDFTPTVLIPANGEFLSELRDRWVTQNGGEPFYDKPQAIAKTLLVGIAWQERGAALFPANRFDWARLKTALNAGSWSAIGGPADWGSFDFVITDPERSNSGQVTLALMAQAEAGTPDPNPNIVTNPAVETLTGLVKRSVYNPPRSTDILLQEFIARGPNDADVATVYESIALHRWKEAQARQGQPYQIYYLSPTVETTSTAAIAHRNVDGTTADAAREFIEFLSAPEQQAVFVQYGFRPVNPEVNLQAVPNSPWSQNIPGAAIAPPIQIQPPPNAAFTRELVRLWQRAQ